MNIEWNEDKTKGTLSAEDIKKLEGNFNNGYGKGMEVGKKEIISKLSFLDVDENNFETSINGMKAKLLELKEGKLPKEITDKIKGSEDVIRDLEKKLEEKTNAFSALQKNSEEFRRSQLIDGKLLELGRRKETEAIDPQDAAILFKLHYNVDIAEDDNLVLRDKSGNAIFTEAGDPLSIDQAYAKFAESKKPLFKAPSNGGSGGGGEGGGGDKTISKAEFDAKQPKERAAIMEAGTVIVEE